jgi:hypothetical protein
MIVILTQSFPVLVNIASESGLKCYSMTHKKAIAVISFMEYCKISLVKK